MAKRKSFGEWDSVLDNYHADCYWYDPATGRHGVKCRETGEYDWFMFNPRSQAYLYRNSTMKLPKGARKVLRYGAPKENPMRRGSSSPRRARNARRNPRERGLRREARGLRGGITQVSGLISHSSSARRNPKRWTKGLYGKKKLTDREKRELLQDLKEWADMLHVSRQAGAVSRFREIKHNIEHQIKKHGLERHREDIYRAEEYHRRKRRNPMELHEIAEEFEDDDYDRETYAGGMLTKRPRKGVRREARGLRKNSGNKVVKRIKYKK